ncbi:EamA family transporter [Endozoicomonas sp. OPT23]|uniref:DMT family transporter n=1 Tax=Endozoicomonas sp. OPT23 TaxID=2072845 RepID=UPI00129B27A3|nr:DMT family transporter [Endozoicomonas sp. OPT23]MRI33076.1 EamA family transporter [Endozoicomonas sp. OPT23]
MIAVKSEPGFTQWIPIVFVLLWSTGFIGAKYALPFIEPFNLLFVRMLITLVVFTGLIVYFKSPWLNFQQACHQMVVGSLIHGAYLGGVFAAIKWQMPAGITSLLVGLQPLLTAFLAWAVISERLHKRQWFGLLLGLSGVCMVLLRGQELGSLSLTWPAILAAMAALVGISIGTLYQKRFGQGVDLFTGAWFQYLATAILMAVLTYSFETQVIDWQPQLILSLTWLVFGLSVAAILLLMLMIQRGAASEVAGYFYLVPPVTAIESWLLFNEKLSSGAILGMLVAVAGVYLVIKSPKDKAA